MQLLLCIIKSPVSATVCAAGSGDQRQRNGGAPTAAQRRRTREPRAAYTKRLKDDIRAKAVDIELSNSNIR